MIELRETSRMLEAFDLDRLNMPRFPHWIGTPSAHMLLRIERAAPRP